MILRLYACFNCKIVRIVDKYTTDVKCPKCRKKPVFMANIYVNEDKLLDFVYKHTGATILLDLKM